jgi:nucleotide-binding universal stress UspA family protein
VSGPYIVGYDGSAASNAALDRALTDAAQSDASLVVVSVAAMPLNLEGPMSYGVVDGPPTTLELDGPPPDVDEMLREAQRKAEAAGVTADYVWEMGDPAEAILRAAGERGAAAIVIGRGHHSRVGRWLGADVAAEVEKSAKCPVVVVEAHDQGRPQSGPES